VHTVDGEGFVNSPDAHAVCGCVWQRRATPGVLVLPGVQSRSTADAIMLRSVEHRDSVGFTVPPQ
jgi:hypothetical protein